MVGEGTMNYVLSVSVGLARFTQSEIYFATAISKV